MGKKITTWCDRCGAVTDDLTGYWFGRANTFRAYDEIKVAAENKIDLCQRCLKWVERAVKDWSLRAEAGVAVEQQAPTDEQYRCPECDWTGLEYEMGLADHNAGIAAYVCPSCHYQHQGLECYEKQ